jgi:hypothetical protein
LFFGNYLTGKNNLKTVQRQVKVWYANNPIRIDLVTRASRIVGSGLTVIGYTDACFLVGYSAKKALAA